MGRFSYRQFQAGDEEEINRLYFEVTGRNRSVREYRWQWHQSLSGPGDIWLIHDDQNDGKLIGHHGVMPIRFTKGKQDLLFGKTENTMVLDDYRTKILYPRFEIRFKKHYEQRYHALFSTMGPDAAIRTRKALGYTFPAQWQSFLVRTSITSDLRWVSLAVSRINNRTRPHCDHRSVISSEEMSKARFLESDAAREHEFFKTFWDTARLNHGISPRRDLADLDWRFWTNPYKPHFTYLVDSNDCVGYGIVTVQNRLAKLEDYAVSVPSRNNYGSLFNGLAAALARAGVYFLRVFSTDDASLREVNRLCGSRPVFCERILNRFRTPRKSEMPRYITSKGRAVGIAAENWAITGVVFEGR